MRKFSDLFTCYADKLHEADVHKMVLSILAKARKLAKPETKATIEELENKVEERLVLFPLRSLLIYSLMKNYTEDRSHMFILQDLS